MTQLVLAIISKDSRLPLERWVFDINLVEQPAAEGSQPYAFDHGQCGAEMLTALPRQGTCQARERDPGRNPGDPEANSVDGDVPAGHRRADGVQHPGVHVGVGRHSRERVGGYGPARDRGVEEPASQTSEL